MRKSTSRTREIKQAQKERLFFREISQLFMQMVLDNPILQSLTLSRVKLSADGGICFIYFASTQGEDDFKQKLEILKLYKSSMRKAIAAQIDARYTPDLVFKFDELSEKHDRIYELLDRIGKE